MEKIIGHFEKELDPGTLSFRSRLFSCFLPEGPTGSLDGFLPDARQPHLAGDLQPSRVGQLQPDDLSRGAPESFGAG